VQPVEVPAPVAEVAAPVAPVSPEPAAPPVQPLEVAPIEAAIEVAPQPETPAEPPVLAPAEPEPPALDAPIELPAPAPAPEPDLPPAALEPIVEEPTPEPPATEPEPTVEVVAQAPLLSAPTPEPVDVVVVPEQVEAELAVDADAEAEADEPEADEQDTTEHEEETEFSAKVAPFKPDVPKAEPPRSLPTPTLVRNEPTPIESAPSAAGVVRVVVRLRSGEQLVDGSFTDPNAARTRAMELVDQLESDDAWPFIAGRSIDPVEIDTIYLEKR
jgi:hypothetical protein